MNFREHQNLTPVVATACSSLELTKLIDELGLYNDIVDLQYSTTTTGDIVEYSALLLVSPKENKTENKPMPQYTYTVCKEMEIAGAHHLNLPYESKCTNFHGHNWKVKVWCKTNNLNESGMVMDFTHIKRLVHDKLDHQSLNEVFDFNPTAENIARWIMETVPNCFKVSIQESDGNVAICERCV